jgi:DNA-binding PadR family transcriptional regulator
LFQIKQLGLDKSKLSGIISINDITNCDIDSRLRMAQSNNSLHEYLPLTPAAFQILLALAEDEKHGYAIMQDVEEYSGGKITIGPGTLYGSLKRMLASGLVEESDDRPDPGLDDQRRRYYRLTRLGRRVLSAEARRLANLLNLARARQVLEGPL